MHESHRPWQRQCQYDRALLKLKLLLLYKDKKENRDSDSLILEASPQQVPLLSL